VSKIRALALAVAACGAVNFDPSSALAQARTLVSATSAQALSAPVASALEDDTAGERDPTPMAFAGVGVKVGLAGMGAGNLRFKREGLPLTSVESRRGIRLALPINLGGDGFGWSIEPYLSKSSITRVTSEVARDGSTSYADGEQADLTSYGLFTGPVYNVHVAAPLYLGAGLGLQAAYVASSAFDRAVDGYLRLPLSATYYVSDQVALVAEVGLGYGASLFMEKEAHTTIDKTTQEVATDSTPMFGTAFAWDCTIGVRLP
jgi:hypothetical protein